MTDEQQGPSQQDITQAIHEMAAAACALSQVSDDGRIHEIAVVLKKYVQLDDLLLDCVKAPEKQQTPMDLAIASAQQSQREWQALNQMNLSNAIERNKQIHQLTESAYKQAKEKLDDNRRNAGSNPKQTGPANNASSSL